MKYQFLYPATAVTSLDPAGHIGALKVVPERVLRTSDQLPVGLTATSPVLMS